MVPEETRKQVLRLKEAGYGIRWIARHLDLSRNTVRGILGLKPPPEGAAARKPSLLEPYKQKIEEILQEDERQRRRRPGQKPLTARRIFKEIRKLGYQGGRTLLAKHVGEVRGPGRRSRRAFRRFETAPGEEAQQDWSTYPVEIGGKLLRIQLFSMILGWSRQQFLRAYLDQRLPTLLWGHVAAFKSFEGVPWRIVYDRQATITPLEIAGKPILTEQFREFAEHYDFKVFLCESGHKERKGKIERPFLYFETSFLPLRRFESLEDLNRQLSEWLEGLEDPEEGNRRKHGTTGEVPQERWLEEKPYLLELPPTDFLPRRLEERQVEKDCTVSVLGSRYSVPARLVEEGRREVWASIGPEDVLLYDKRGELVARHKLSEEKGRLVLEEAHYAELERRRRSKTVPELERQFLERFPGSQAFLDRLKETLRSIAPIHLRELLVVARRYRVEEVREALERAVADGTPTAGYVREILCRKLPTGRLGEIAREIPKGLSLGPVDPGSPAGYGDIFQDQPKEQDP
ncbi:MAG: IS21 family transposase [Planctomycetes bacterium]|nr:IS21 family transposase [Planctomycetota bacterium]